jgi:hypothetical protein
MAMLAQDRRSSPDEIHRSGEQITEAQPGSLCCVSCGFAFSISALDSLPECPNCHGRSFKRTALFDRRPQVDVAALEVDEDTDWLTEARAELDRAGRYLAFDEGDGGYAVIRLETGWTRIGRSRAADVQLDDATVSRRHALIVLTETGELRALDDRSLNGLFVNGERVDWAPLSDGDELEIGRYRLHLLEA